MVPPAGGKEHQATKPMAYEEKIWGAAFPLYFQNIRVQKEVYLGHPSEDSVGETDQYLS